MMSKLNEFHGEDITISRWCWQNSKLYSGIGELISIFNSWSSQVKGADILFLINLQLHFWWAFAF